MSAVFRRLALASFVVLAACADRTTAPSTSPAHVVTVTPVAQAVYQSDLLTLQARVRRIEGEELPGAAVTWTADRPDRVEIGAGGQMYFLQPGPVTLTARYGDAQGSVTIDVQRLVVQQVQVLPTAFQLTDGQVAMVGVKPIGQGGRWVTGRTVTITSDDPRIAVVDPSGRLRGVAPGVTTVRATADGVTGSAQVTVTAQTTLTSLRTVDDTALPILVARDTVDYFGTRELHEVYIEGGQFGVSAVQGRYDLDVRYVEYAVFTTGDVTTRALRLRSREHDWGDVSYDARGDLVLQSAAVGGLSHTAAPTTDGFRVRYRIPGTDIYQLLDYRR
jgi:hypothetical protein